MSTCSAAEIENKRRMALEKLKAKKANLNTNSNIPSTNIKNTTIKSPQTTNVSNFYKKSPSTSTSSSATENKASSFLNALKHSSVLSNRNGVRESSHPYQRPPGAKPQFGEVKKPSLSLTPPVAPVFTKSVTCSVYLISASRFEVKPSGYHAKLIDIFKTISSRAYDAKTKLWNFLIQDYQEVHQKVTLLNPDVVIGTIPKSVINLCFTPPKELDYTCLKSIEQTLADKLLPFQEEGVCFAVAQHGRLMICDEMGLGKTYQALAVADYYKDNWPLLICTTASTREPWANHVRNLLPSIPVHYVQVLTNNQQYFGDAKVLITSYNMMERHMTSLLERKFGFLIFDESHMLKNSKAKCTTVADRLAMQAKHVILLSGTPALSRPLELFTQLQMIDRKFMNYIEFTSRYCDGKQSQYGWDASGQSNLQELKVVLKLKYMIRRTKADVLPDMAAKFRETVVLDSSLIWQNDDMKANLDIVAKNFIASKGREREEILLKFYQQTASVKTRAVCAYLKTILKSDIKFIVFAHHRIMLDAISDSFIKMGVDFVRIDGSTRNDARAEYIKHFQNSSSCKAAVLSLKACNSGITLTAAEMIIFAELDWNPSTLAQAESRAHRIGQEKTVTCRYLMASHTADDVIWNMLKSKQDTLNRAGLFCENLQNATKTINQTTSYNIDNYYSPNRVRKSTGKVNENGSNLNDSLNNSYESRKSETIQSPIDKFLKPTKKAPPLEGKCLTYPNETDSWKNSPSTAINPNKYTLDANKNNLNQNSSSQRNSCSSMNSSRGSSKLKETDLFDEFFNDDHDDAIAALKSQVPAKTFPKDPASDVSIAKPNPKPKAFSNNYEDLFDDEDDADIATLKSQVPSSHKITSKTDCLKECENIDDFFGEDDDDAFKDLNF